MRGTFKRTRVRTREVLAIFIILKTSSYKPDLGGGGGSCFYSQQEHNVVSFSLQRFVRLGLVEQVREEKQLETIFYNSPRVIRTGVTWGRHGGVQQDEAAFRRQNWQDLVLG